MNTNNLENSIFIEMSNIENPVENPIVSDVVDKSVPAVIENSVPYVIENPVHIIIENPIPDVIENPVPIIIDVIEIQVSDVIENPIPDVIENSVSIVIENPELDVIEFQVPVENQISVKKNSIDQDTLQRVNVGIQFLLEMYRVITSSLLILFVPQICDDHICTTSENLVWETNTYNTALCFNFISMTALVIMYYLELVRENRLIKYMSVNTNFANDDDDVAKRLELLPNDKKNKIFEINKYYKLSSYGAVSIYSLNVILSAVAVNKYYAGSQTTSTFITYVLFIATKFSSVYSLVSTAKNIFYSAYMKANVQFNDVDGDFIKEE